MYSLPASAISARAEAKIYFSSPIATFKYSDSGFTASATFPGRVHGVVVHARMYVSDSFVNSNFAVTEMSVISL